MALCFLRRNYRALYPPDIDIPKVEAENLIRVGIIGASKIAPKAIIFPARSHPEVIIHGIAARNLERARRYAQWYGIKKWYGDYQDLISDPEIDAVYVALPNSLHYEWGLKALKAGKHVLIEKPSTSNATEAALLHHHGLLQQPNAPVLLEAFHVLFHPAWSMFLSLLDPKSIESAHTSFILPKYYLADNDIRYVYDLSGGSLMDLGTYNVFFLRQIFGVEPVECLEATAQIMPVGFDQKCDQAMTAKWRFPNGGVGTMRCDLSASTMLGLPRNQVPVCKVIHKVSTVDDIEPEYQQDREHVLVRTVTILNPLVPFIWHRISIVEQHTIRTIDGNATIKAWSHSETKTAYTWEKEASESRPGFDYWSTYRFQLEAFVDRVKGRAGSGCWMDGSDSVKQMEMVDSAYQRAGLPLRPTSSYH